MNDKNCIDAVLEGQTNAFSLLVDRYQDMVYRVCLKMVKNPKDAEDLTQDVFIKAYEALASFRGDAVFSTWLYKITIRKCLDWQRSRSRSKEDPIENDAMLKLGESQTPEYLMISKEEKKDLERVVSQLAEPYKTVVNLYYFQKRSYQEITKQTGIPVKTIESQLYRARKMLKSKLGDE